MIARESRSAIVRQPASTNDTTSWQSRCGSSRCRGSRQLAPAVRGPGVDPDHQRRRRVRAGEHVVDQLQYRRPERGPVAPHADRAGVTLDQVDHREARVRLGVVPRREVHPQRAPPLVTERVVPQRRGLDGHVLVPADEVGLPRPHAGHTARRPARRGTGLKRCSTIGYSLVRAADVAQLVEHHLAKVRVAGSNPVVRSEMPSGVLPYRGSVPGLAEWPSGLGKGLQSPVRGFDSRLRLGRLAQRESASLTRKRSQVQIL